MPAHKKFSQLVLTNQRLRLVLGNSTGDQYVCLPEQYLTVAVGLLDLKVLVPLLAQKCFRTLSEGIRPRAIPVGNG